MTEEVWHPAALFLLTFLSEDAAVLAGGVAAAASPNPFAWMTLYLACFLGIWSGDLGLYLLAARLGRPLVGSFWGGNPAVAAKILRSEEWFRGYGITALVICRVIPGMRLPTYLSAGLLRMPVVFFTVITGTLAALWTAVIFILISILGKGAPELIHRLRSNIGWLVIAILLLLLLTRLLPGILRSLFNFVRNPRLLIRRVHWEFWPAWLFYIPVGLNYLRLAAWHRGLTLPTCANPGMSTGGLIGESKYATLRELQEAHPDHVATSSLLGAGKEERMTFLQEIMTLQGLTYPVVLKPDVAQRGSGFKVARSHEEAHSYLSQVLLPIVVQRYIPGPHEAGIFYYRLPGQTKGSILAITEKIFPAVAGNGTSTLEELILNDPRASAIADTYLHRFANELGRIPSPGERIRLVEAGNHAQGCIFRDGMHLRSDALERRIDKISQSINGFFIGRYDLRYIDPGLLAKGESFHILELNGASAEATSAYDASKSLGNAYAMLFKQWELVFEIAARNRSLGHRPDSAWRILSEWLTYREQSHCHPSAD